MLLLIGNYGLEFLYLELLPIAIYYTGVFAHFNSIHDPQKDILKNNRIYNKIVMLKRHN